MSDDMKSPLRITFLAAGLSLLAACATPAPPPPAMPSRPLPPMGASPSMVVPMIAADGVRQTINANISQAQTTWNVRSAFNVAALNCLSPQHAGILENYKAFLTNFDKQLDKANSTVEAEFREQMGDRRAGRTEFDSYMTKVYNYFTLPPAKAAFCDAALELSNESVLVAPADLDSFSTRAMVRFEGVFEDFFRAFERYQTNVATWDRLYGAPAGLYPAVQVAEGAASQGRDGVILLNAPATQAAGESSGSMELGMQSEPMLSVPQSAQSVTVAPSTASEAGDDAGTDNVLPDTAATGTPGEVQGAPEPNPSF